MDNGPVSNVQSHSSLMREKSEDKEIIIAFSHAPCQAELATQQASGLYVPSAQDTAPFSGNKLVIVKKPSPKKRGSFALEEELKDDQRHAHG
jgi:hypothetical protein